MVKKSIKIIFITIICICGLYLTYLLTPLLVSLKEEENRLYFKSQIESLGILGLFIVIGLQIIQIVIAFIPGDFIELFAGMIYGMWGGLLVCLFGIFLANLVVYFIVKQIIFRGKENQRFAFLKNAKHLEVIVFIIYFMPIVPKDAVTYFMPATNLSLKKFMTISLIARAPSIFSMTYMGNSLMQGNIWQFLAILIISGLFSLMCIVFYQDLLNLLEHKK